MGQKKLSIPDWVWARAEAYYKDHREELVALNITSTTGLIRYWILQETKDIEIFPE